MSSSNSQRLRRNASPTTPRQGPLRATQQFSLLNAGSGTGSPSRKTKARRTPTSPTLKAHRLAKNRSHSETGFVSEWRSPASPSYKVEKPAVLRAGGSLESINLYLSGQWPKDGSRNKSDTINIFNQSSQNYCDEVFKKDECTQTPDDWDDVDIRKSSYRHGYYKRSHSVGSGDNWHLKSKDIKARLQRKDSSSRGSQTSYRFSPIPTITSAFSPLTSQPIKIPTPAAHENGVLRGTPGKARASVEGLNQEVEKLIISGHLPKSSSEDIVSNTSLFDCPDGRRAPFPDPLMTRSVDTQTPSQSDNLQQQIGDIIFEAATSDGHVSSQASSDAEDSRPQSLSPSFIPGAFDMDDSITIAPSGDAVRNTHGQITTSPNPKSNFVRLPPDGAEKIRVVDETLDVTPKLKTFLTPPAASIRLQPSERSAFQSLLKKPTLDVASHSTIQILDECCVEHNH